MYRRNPRIPHQLVSQPPAVTLKVIFEVTFMDSERRSLYLYLLPVFGFFPAWWTLYRYRSKTNGVSTAQRDASRLSVTLGLIWIAGHLLTEFGANHTESHGLSLLIFSSLWTSSYILIEMGLMVRIWQRRSLQLPGIGDLSRKLP